MSKSKILQQRMKSLAKSDFKDAIKKKQEIKDLETLQNEDELFALKLKLSNINSTIINCKADLEGVFKNNKMIENKLKLAYLNKQELELKLLQLQQNEK